jgi:hypothetical protein
MTTSYPFKSVEEEQKPNKKAIASASWSYVPPPPRALNGGLFTGEPFAKGAPWANVPVIPDVDYMTNVNLRSARPPTQALFQYPGNTRPGNNYQENTGLQPYVGDRGFTAPYNFSCIPCDKIKEDVKCKCKNISFISGNEYNTCTCADKVFIGV